MGPRTRKIALTLSAATMAVAALLPGVVITPAQVTVTGDIPGPDPRIELTAPQAPADDTEAPVTADVPQTAATTPSATEAAPERAEVAAAPGPDDGSDPATWVSSVDVLGFDDLGPQEPAAGGGPCPKATTCDANVVRPQRWKTSTDGTLTIPWRFNDEGRRNLRAPTGLLESAVRAGMSEWMRWNSNIRFAYAGTTTASFAEKGDDGSCADGINTITWTRMDASIIAAVGTCVDPKTNTVRDADLALNVTQHWEDIVGEPQSRHTFDIRSIVTHELGHILSLLDLYDAGSLRQTMMGNAEYGETRKRTLALGDVIGLQTAYQCGKGDTCPREGIVDD